MSDLPPEAYDDCFHPPSIPTQVFCLHCQEIYDSYLIEWREEKMPSGRQGFWRCPTPGCGGAGFGFDIHPLDPDYIDPDGRDMGEWCYDDVDEDGEFLDDDEDAPIEALDESLASDISAFGEFDSDDSPGPSLNEIEEAAGLEPSLTGPADEDEPYAIPMDDLLPENEAIDLPPLTPEQMDEIERKLGWHTDPADSPGPSRDTSAPSSEGRGTAPPRSPSSRDDRDRPEEDDIPF